MTGNIDEMLSLDEAAKRTGVDRMTIHLAVRAGEIRAWSMPAVRGLLVRQSEILAWAERRKQRNHDRA